jgi:biopolymer transport protein ExbD
MEVPIPEPTAEPQPINHEDVLNLVLAENNKIYWWIGLESKPEITYYSFSGIGKVLIKENQDNPKLMVLIKVKNKARYGNMVDMLDELTLSGISRYAIVDFTEVDNAKIAGL